MTFHAKAYLRTEETRNLNILFEESSPFRAGGCQASERGWKVLDAIRDMADEVDATPAQVSLRWLMDHDDFTCVPIIGARTTEQLDENVSACDVDLSEEQWNRIMDVRYREDDTLWGH